MDILLLKNIYMWWIDSQKGDSENISNSFLKVEINGQEISISEDFLSNDFEVSVNWDKVSINKKDLAINITQIDAIAIDHINTDIVVFKLKNNIILGFNLFGKDKKSYYPGMPGDPFKNLNN